MAKQNPTAAKNPRASKYTEPGRAHYPLTVHACHNAEQDRRGPGYCPFEMDTVGIEGALARYDSVPAAGCKG